jgi:hypothetical protein
VNQQLEQLATTHQVVGQMANAITGDSTPSISKISFKDVQVDHFYGNSNRDATFVHVDELSQLQSWLECSVGRMRDVGLPTKQHVPKLISSLRGPAERAFRSKYGPFDKSTWDIDECRRALLSLVPDSTFFFFKQANSMHFRSEHLPDDIRAFGLAIEYASPEFGDTHSPNTIHWNLFRTKILEAKPSFFEEALNTYGTSVHQSSLRTFVNSAVSVAERMTCDRAVIRPRPHKDGSKHLMPRFPHNKPHIRTESLKRQGNFDDRPSTSKQSKSSATPHRAPQQLELLSQFQRCTKCAWYCANAADMAAHKCQPAAFKKRFGILESLHKQGKDPNARLK